MMWFRLCRVPPAPKDAVTDAAALNVTLHALLPVQAPDHPENWLGAFAVSVSATAVPDAKLAEQPVVDPLVQSMPDGSLVTVPVPAPVVATVRTYEPGAGEPEPDEPSRNPAQPTSGRNARMDTSKKPIPRKDTTEHHPE